MAAYLGVRGNAMDRITPPSRSTRLQQQSRTVWQTVLWFAGLLLALGLLLAAGCSKSERGEIGEPPVVPLDAADSHLVEVVDELQQAVRALPTSAEMRGRLAMAYEVNEFEAAAAVAYAQAEALDRRDFRWPYFQALLSSEGGDPEEALEHLSRAIAIDETYVPAWLYRGVWLSGLGDSEQAREAFEHALRLGADANAKAGIAQTLLGEKRHAEAIVLLEPLSAELRHPHVYRMLGRAYQAAGRADDAKIALARGRQATPLQWRDPLQHQKWGYLANWGGQLVHAENLLRTERYAEAVAVLEPMRERRAADDAVLSNLSLAYARTGQLDRAFETVNEGFANWPDHFRFHNVISTLYREQGDIDRAIEHLQRSVAQEPVQVWPHERLGAALMEQERYDEALDAYGKALEYGTEKPEAIHYTMGLLHGIGERWQAAIERFERAIELNAAYTKAHINLGRCLAEVGRFEEARAALAWAERLNTHPAELASAHRRLASLSNVAAQR